MIRGPYILQEDYILMRQVEKNDLKSDYDHFFGIFCLFMINIMLCYYMLLLCYLNLIYQKIKLK